MRQPAGLVVDPITIGNFAAPFNCIGPDLKLFISVGLDRGSSSVADPSGLN